MSFAIDHVVLIVRDIEATVAFYERAFGIDAYAFGEGRRALQLGAQKMTEQQLDELRTRLDAEGIAIVDGPVAKSDARGPITSLYVTDPDANLIEVSTYA